MSEPEPGATPPKRTFFDEFKSLAWWQIVLIVAPLLLVVVGGLLGALCGLAAAAVGVRVTRTGLSTGAKAAVMVLADVVAVLIFVVLGALILGIG